MIVAPRLNGEGRHLPPRMTLDPRTREGLTHPPVGRGSTQGRMGIGGLATPVPVFPLMENEGSDIAHATCATCLRSRPTRDLHHCLEWATSAPWGLRTALNSLGGCGGGVGAQREVSSSLPPHAPSPPEHRKDLAQRPQIQFCASNLSLCLVEKEGPWSSTVTSQTLRHTPRGEERIRRQFRAFLPAPRQARLPSPGSVAPALAAPTPWASQRATVSQAQTLCSQRRRRAQHPGCWQQAEDTELLMCTFCPGLLPYASQWYLNKVCSSVCPYFPVLQPPQSTCNSLLPPLIYLVAPSPLFPS